MLADVARPPFIDDEDRSFVADGRDWAAVADVLRAAVDSPAPALPGDALAWAPPQLPPWREPPQMARVRTTWACSLAYYGPQFCGYAWQRDDPGRTVQGALERAIEPLLGGRHAAVLSCAGRTDAGVSATGQLASFYAWEPIELAELRDAVDACAPGSMRLLCARRVPREFHATFGAHWRRYVYLLPLRGADDDVCAGALDAQLAPLAGVERDYAALGRGLPSGKRTRATILHASARHVQLRPGGADARTVDAVRIELVADRFLRRQVRTLVATAVLCARDAARGMARPALLARACGGRQEDTAAAAPALGLCFAEAGYEPWARNRLAV
ncbi:hypothetical protein KFE25_007676 [Diacronema lutheri]|uniref:tRNA pseudouridine synthase n=2 Tax=Diacronema lutheri TaxID=2081491 RepID=A0A8J5XJT1_DIALT|nr:hypothetical protein KFE25_007676 [Diacronema lutheri]